MNPLARRCVCLTTASLAVLAAFSPAPGKARIVGIEIPSATMYRVPPGHLDSPPTSDVEGIKSCLQSLGDGDVLVIGMHSNPDVFACRDEPVHWSDFWKHFGVTKPPRLAAVVFCGCMYHEDRNTGEITRISAAEMERNRASLNTEVLFAPRGAYGLVTLPDAAQIVKSLKDGDDLATIIKKVDRNYGCARAPGVELDWRLAAGLVGQWERTSDKHRVSFKRASPSREGVEYEATITSVGPLDVYGFTENEMTFQVCGTTEVGVFTGTVKWRWTGGKEEWRPVTITLKGPNSLETDSVGSWTRVTP